MTDRFDEELLLSQFVALATKRSEYLADHNPKKANDQYDKLHRLLKTKIRLLPDKGLSLLMRVVESTNDEDILIITAASLLALDESYAIGVLQRVQLSDGPGAFTAKWTIREWGNGNMREFWS